MKRIAAIVILLSTVSGALWGAEVTRVAKNGRMAIVSIDSGMSWQVDDRICLKRTVRNLCGRITKIASQRAVVQFDNQGPAVSVGELVLTNRATQRREPTAEPDFSDLRGGPSKSDSSSPSSFSDDEPHYRFNGLVVLDSIYPAVSLQYAILDKTTIGLTPSYYRFGYLGVNAGLLGANLSVTSYFSHLFKGWWAELEGGIFSAGVSYNKGTDTVLAANLQIMGGYRWRFGERWNLGVGAGIRDISLSHSSALHFSLNVWLPAARLDFGLTF